MGREVAGDKAQHPAGSPLGTLPHPERVRGGAGGRGEAWGTFASLPATLKKPLPHLQPLWTARLPGTAGPLAEGPDARGHKCWAGRRCPGLLQESCQAIYLPKKDRCALRCLAPDPPPQAHKGSSQGSRLSAAFNAKNPFVLRGKISWKNIWPLPGLSLSSSATEGKPQWVKGRQSLGDGQQPPPQARVLRAPQ